MPKKVLNIGCGSRACGNLPDEYRTPQWTEIRLDINNDVSPDIVGDMRDMHMVADSSIDAIFSCHNIEHVYCHEVIPTLKEFFRILVAGGEILIGCPDLQQIARLIAEDKLMDPVYSLPVGQIAPIDMLYGFRASIAGGNHHMSHKTGFTQTSIKSLLHEAGFHGVRTATRPLPMMDIWAHAFK